ncbi:putative F-box/LRR-repeat protein At3g18150 isoform X1 [Punica granatum]|uniref:F-box/LRR-repeat protein At3g18150 isoform X1 n=1 Tax=Punica granatum TaxID=22663 RepID=A0A6P8CY66_PUNGR|nr:putative F-box/LRR-repeat protein At3g18150 isoform X1 [Punica granatum]
MVREGANDLMSELPNYLIDHIFSFVPTNDVVKASIWSRSWRHRWWTHVENLEILDLHVAKEADYIVLISFCNFMKRLDEQRPWGKTLQRFSLNLPTHFFHRWVDKWISFAIRNKVKHLCLNLMQTCMLPDFMCNHFELEGLHIAHSSFSYKCPGFDWPCLEKLSLTDVLLSKGTLSKIFLGSPVLQLPKLERCTGLNGIEIEESQGLRELVIDSHQGDAHLEIIAPSLLILRLRGHYGALKLTKVSSVVKAELDFYLPEDCFLSNVFKDVLNKLQHVSTLHICGWCNEQMVSRAGYNCPELSKCKHLIIDSGIDQLDLYGVTSLLARSPHLDKLELRNLQVDHCDRKFSHGKRKWNDAFSDGDMLCRSRKYIFKSLVKYLKKHVKTLVIRWSDAATGQPMTRAFDLGDGGKEMVQSLAQQISSYPGVCP